MDRYLRQLGDIFPMLRHGPTTDASECQESYRALRHFYKDDAVAITDWFEPLERMSEELQRKVLGKRPPKGTGKGTKRKAPDNGGAGSSADAAGASSPPFQSGIPIVSDESGSDTGLSDLEGPGGEGSPM